MKNKLLLPEIIIAAVLLLLAFIFAAMYFTSHTNLKNQLALEKLKQQEWIRQHQMDSIMISDILVKKDSLVAVIGQQRIDLAGYDYKIADLNKKRKYLLDSLSKLNDTAFLAVLKEQTRYVYNPKDSMVITPIPVIKEAVILIAEGESYKEMCDTLTNVNKTYKEYAGTLQAMVELKGKEIGLLQKDVGGLQMAINTLNGTLTESNNKLKKARQRNWIISGVAIVAGAIAILK